MRCCDVTYWLGLVRLGPSLGIVEYVIVPGRVILGAIKYGRGVVLYGHVTCW